MCVRACACVRARGRFQVASFLSHNGFVPLALLRSPPPPPHPDPFFAFLPILTPNPSVPQPAIIATPPQRAPSPHTIPLPQPASTHMRNTRVRACMSTRPHPRAHSRVGSGCAWHSAEYPRLSAPKRRNETNQGTSCSTLTPLRCFAPTPSPKNPSLSHTFPPPSFRQHHTLSLSCPVLARPHSLAAGPADPHRSARARGGRSGTSTALRCRPLRTSSGRASHSW